MKLCTRLLMVFGWNFCKKQQIWVSEPHFGEVRSDARLSWWPVGKPIVDFLFSSVFALIELISLSTAVPELWGEMCTAQLFRRGWTSLHSNFAWTGSSPIKHKKWAWIGIFSLTEPHSHGMPVDYHVGLIVQWLLCYFWINDVRPHLAVTTLCLKKTSHL